MRFIEHKEKMDGWTIAIVVIILIVVLVAIALMICYTPNYQRPRNHHGHRTKHVPHYILGLRSQVGSDILPTIAIGTTPTDIQLNQPMCDTGYMTIPRSGVYQIFYGVDLRFEGPGMASTAVRRRSCDGTNGFEILTGSAREAIVSQATMVNMNNSFFAQLNKGDQLKITAIANSTETVIVPSSDSSFLQSPEALASLQVVLKS